MELPDPPVARNKKFALGLVDDLDDYARMTVGIAPTGAVGALNTYINDSLTPDETRLARYCIKELLEHLPTNRDWLPPEIERQLKELTVVPPTEIYIAGQ